MYVLEGELYLTAMELAEIVAYPELPEGAAKAMRQIRHWTQSDLLKTKTPKSVGRGRSRLYDSEATVLVAAVLMELSRFGITVDKMRPVADLLYEEYEPDSDMIFFAALTDEVNGYILIDWNIDPKTGVFGEPRVEFFNDADYDELREPGIDRPHSSSATVIHMNSVSDRLNWDYLNILQRQ